MLHMALAPRRAALQILILDIVDSFQNSGRRPSGME